MNDNNKILTLRDNAKAELLQIKTVEDGISYLNKLKAIDVWVKAEKKDAELQNIVAEQKLRTQRILGELVAEGQRKGTIASVGNPDKFNSTKREELKQIRRIEDIGLTHKQSSAFQQIASIPDDDFEEFIQEKKQGVNKAVAELTTTGAVKLAKSLNSNHKNQKYVTDKNYEQEVKIYSSESTRSLPSIDLKSNGASKGEDKVNGHEDRSYCKKILITPDKAMELLKKNEAKNRRPKPGKIARYANDMKEGRWKGGTWETIKIAEDGSLIDGQNRLYAVVKSGASILFNVAFNVPKDVFDVLDTGTPRNAADVFTIAGVKYGSVIPPIIQQFHVLKQNKNYAHNVGHTDKLTNAELLDKYYQNEGYWQDVAKRAFRWYDEFQKVVTVSVLGGFYAFFSTKSIQDAEKFMEQLATGNGIQNNVIAKLRRKMFEDRLAIRKMPIGMKFGLILKSWNTFRSKGEVKQLKFDSEREALPVAI